MSSKSSCRRAIAPLSRTLGARPVTVTMPLKARITNPAFSTPSRQNVSQEEYDQLAYPKEEPGDEPNDVLFSSLYGMRTIELNRPKKLNALNGSMIRKILPRMKEWEKSQMANVIIMAGAGEKAFCAGGDVAALAIQNKESLEQGSDEGPKASGEYFDLEYRLDHTIASYGKPYIAYMDGITMGGGVGLSVHAPIRIATERTVFAMPETTIGFFPDVGASFFLSRLDGAIGTYLALTSDRLTGADVFHAGIATHYIESSSLSLLTQRLAESDFKDYLSMEERLRAINATIEEYTTGLPQDKPALLTGKLRQAIDRCFSPLVVEDILAALQKEIEADSEGPVGKWAAKTRATILERSPTSVRVTRRLLDLGLGWDIRQSFEREASLAANFMRHPDFNEGVTAKLVDKPARKPSWQPAALEQVSDKAVDRMIKAGTSPLKLVGGTGSDGYTEYPYPWIGLPSESEIRKVVEGKAFKQFDQVINEIVKARNGKQGTAEKVIEVLRRCAKQEGGQVKWTEEALGLSARQKVEFAKK